MTDDALQRKGRPKVTPWQKQHAVETVKVDYRSYRSPVIDEEDQRRRKREVSARCRARKRGEDVPLLNLSLAERFELKVERIPFLTCWVWLGTIAENGYGRIRVSPADGVKAAHRIAYALYRGEIPAGLTLDHRCRNRWCVNPWHLEPETHRANVLLGDSFAARNAKKTHCVRGHTFDAINTRVLGGGEWRGCRECERFRINRRRRQQREKAAR